jgi:general stress protein CsbA
MKRLAKSAKFWTLVTGVLTMVCAKLKLNFTSEELAMLVSLFGMVIGAIMAEDVASAKAKSKSE